MQNGLLSCPFIHSIPIPGPTIPNPTHVTRCRVKDFKKFMKVALHKEVKTA